MVATAMVSDFYAVFHGKRNKCFNPPVTGIVTHRFKLLVDLTHVQMILYAVLLVKCNFIMAMPLLALVNAMVLQAPA